mgnify:CR=1 FL=1
MALPNNIFTGYNPKQLQTLAQRYGYTDANLDNFGKFLEENPARAKQYFDQQNLDMFGADKMRQFQQGGVPPVGAKPQYYDKFGRSDAERNPYGFTRQPGAAAQVLVPYYNPKTGEKWTAPSAGWSPPSADWTTRAKPQLELHEEGSVRPQPFQPPTYDPRSPVPFMPTMRSIPTPVGSQPVRPEDTVPDPPPYPGIAQEATSRILQPELPPGTRLTPSYTPFEQAQLLGSAGQVAGDVRVPTSTEVSAAQAGIPTATAAPTVTATTAAPAIQALPSTAQELAAPTQSVEAAQQAQTQVTNLQAAQQAQAAQVQAPAERALQTGEQIALPTGQAAQAAAFVDPVAQAAVAAPTEEATVQGQLATLLQQFESGEAPAWARGAIRTAQQTLLARGLGASSIAGQAIVQAAMEAALPIAQLDAATVAKFEAQNLTNRQQAAMVQAQYRAQFIGKEFDTEFQTRVQNAAKISDVANRNFTAEQQIALENSRLAQTVDIENLKNRQALVLAEAGALTNLDIANLNNRQQAQVQNAQNFLQLDVKNLTNAQQSAILDSQQQSQALLTDAAAENTARQLNAKSQQQTDQFYQNLVATIGQTNSSQTNAINQFNAGQRNSLNRFNSEIVNQRDQFNAKNQLAIEQSNAVWRREIATADTAAANFANQLNAQNLLNLSNQAYANLWQEYRDVMEFAWQAGENEQDRLSALQMAQLNIKAKVDLTEYAAERDRAKGIGDFLGKMLLPFAQTGIGIIGSKLPLIGGLFK